MTHHILKIESTHWSAKALGVKLFETRKDDRNFQVGDTVQYIVLDSSYKRPRSAVYEIIYVLKEYQLDGYVTFAERLIDA